ncbi:MAG: hypothetical protein FWD61_13100 [Phycisphaerales bacterium]|nr:hypothetical protein [Phycisphaerales bacterium]
MREVLLRLLGIWSEQAGRIVKVGFSYHGDVPLWLAILLAIALVAMVIWLYQHTPEALAQWRRIVLTALRSAVLCLIILLLVHPIIAITTAGSIRQSLLILVDNSRSMQIADMRIDPLDARRAALVTGTLDPRKGIDQKPDKPLLAAAPIRRIDLVQESLKTSKLNLLPRLDRDFDLTAYSFDRDVHELAIPKPRDQAPTTTVSEFLVSVLLVSSLLGVLIGIGVILVWKPRTIGLYTTAGCLALFIICYFTLGSLDRKRQTAVRGTQDVAYNADWIARLQADGNQTAIGDAVRDAILRKRGQPVAGLLLISDGGNNAGSLASEAAKLAHEENLPIYTYGVGIEKPRDIIVGGVIAPSVSFVKDEVSVTVRVRGQGLEGQNAQLVLKLGSDIVDHKEITFLGESEQVIPMKFTPAKIGDFDLTASIDPRPDEVVKDNNSATRHVRIIDDRIKVLVIDQLPRWEFKYLQAMLLRDRRVDAKFLLLDASPDIADIKDSPYIKSFPPGIRELSAFDLIVFGDIDPKRLTPIQLDTISDFVSRYGGSLIMIAGKSFAPSAYKNTPIERMLPVEFEQMPRTSAISDADRPIKLELTPRGRTVPMLRIADNDTDNANKWSALPPIYWEARVTRAKPAADVLVVDPDPAKASRFGKMPVIAMQQYGLGNVLFIGTDNTWRWRKNTGDADHQRLWGQTLERMALLHLLGGSKRTQLTVDRDNYSTGDRVTVYARLYNPNLEGLTDPTVKASFSTIAAGDAATEFNLRALPDQPGMYRGEFVAPAAGSYRLKVATDPNTSLDFTVAQQSLELGETALNKSLLEQLSRETGGRFIREEDLYTLPETIKSTAQQQFSTTEVEFCCSPLYFILIVMLLGFEWTMRKLVQLK